MKFISLHLKNYQAHVDTTVNFVDGFNVIIGHTDAGKSSIIRALMKLIRDEPVGKGGIHTGKDEYVLTLIFENHGVQYTLTRTVSTSKNEYSLQKVGEDNQLFANFGREIPQEILDALSMTLVQLENDESIDLHFSGQYDVPFMLANTASTRARLLGRIAGLHILGKASLAANKDERQISTELARVLSEKSRLQEDIKKLPDVDALEQKVKGVQAALDVAKRLADKTEELQKLSANLKSIRDVGKQTLKEYNSLPQIVADFQQLRTQVVRIEELSRLQQKLQEIIQNITTTVSPKEIDVDFTLSNILVEKIMKLSEVKPRLAALDKDISNINLADYDAKITSLEVERQNLLIELKICPVCNQPITQVHNHDKT